MSIETAEIRHIIALASAGASADSIADALRESSEAADFADAAYGSPDEDRDGPDSFYCDARYSRNDAGEWLGFM
jgi:hypothetical protein